MLPRDPQADIGRRAWVACPNCDDRQGCGDCEQNRTCSEHWRYLLSHTGSLLHLQCRSCTHVWTHETRELTLAWQRSVPVAALTADLATENDATRLARSGAPVKQVLTDGLCHLEAAVLAGQLKGWLPENTRLLFVENVGNLVCPASYDLGETLRVILASVTEGEDKPLKYPTAFGLAQLVVVTKTDIAEAVEFDEAVFRANVERVNPGVEVVLTSVRRGQGIGTLLDRALAAAEGATPHTPVMARAAAAPAAVRP